LRRLRHFGDDPELGHERRVQRRHRGSEWQMYQNLGTVTVPAAGLYVLTFTLFTHELNPDYFTFTKM